MTQHKQQTFPSIALSSCPSWRRRRKFIVR